MEEETSKPESGKAEAKSPGGLGAWLPLICSLLLMPALAYATTVYILLPKLQKALAGETEHPPAERAQGVKASAREAAKPKEKVPLSKIVVNVSGSQGARLLLASLTLAGSAGDFKARLENNIDQLRDLAAGILSSKTIADLEKPESRNLIRSELISQFNAALGDGFVQEIYITEFAIQ